MNKVNFVLSSQVTFNVRFAWSNRKEQKKEGKKACTKFSAKKEFMYTKSVTFFFLETQFLL